MFYVFSDAPNFRGAKTPSAPCNEDSDEPRESQSLSWVLSRQDGFEKNFKAGSHINMILQELKDFSNETSIHGPSQIGNDKSSIVKRLLWLGIFVGCLAYGARELTISISGT